MTATLWHIEISHYNEKARWALDYKRIPHRRLTPLPGMHRARVLLLTRGAHQRLPVLELEGRRIGDSTAIIAALEDYRPEPALYPADPEERRRALALEDYFDEELAPRLRRYVWHHTLTDPAVTVETLMPRAGSARKRAMRALMPLAAPLVRRDYGAHPEAADEALAGIRAAMDRVERERQPSGYLVGDSFSVADLTAAALFTPVLAPPQRPYVPSDLVPEVEALRAELAAREGGAWVAEMYARHRGTSAELRG